MAKEARRRFFAQAGALGLGLLPKLRNVSIVAVPLRSSSALAAVDPATALAVATAAISVIDRFTAKGDGGMGGMLQGILSYQRTSLELLVNVITSVATIQNNIAELREQLPFILEQSRLRSYFDDITSASKRLALIMKAATDSSGSQRTRYSAELLQVENAISEASGRLQQYASLDAAITLSLCAACEVSVRYRTGKARLIPSVLRQYLDWADRILDETGDRSLAATLKSELADYSSYLATSGISPLTALPDPVGCVNVVIVEKTPAGFEPSYYDRQFAVWLYGDVELIDRDDAISKQWVMKTPSLPIVSWGGDGNPQVCGVAKRIFVRSLNDYPGSSGAILELARRDPATSSMMDVYMQRAKGKSNSRLAGANTRLIRLAFLARMLHSTQLARWQIERPYIELGGQ